MRYYTYRHSTEHLCRFNAYVYEFWEAGGLTPPFWLRYSKTTGDQDRRIVLKRGDFVRRAVLELALLHPEVVI